MSANNVPARQGLGVNSVPVEAKTYAEIQAEDQRRELAQASMGRWSTEAKEPLPPGAVPRMTGGPWAHPDGLGIDEPVNINPGDPSGTERNKGVI